MSQPVRPGRTHPTVTLAACRDFAHAGRAGQAREGGSHGTSAGVAMKHRPKRPTARIPHAGQLVNTSISHSSAAWMSTIKTPADLVCWGIASWSIASAFSPCPHMVQNVRGLSGASFYQGTNPTHDPNTSQKKPLLKPSPQGLESHI